MWTYMNSLSAILGLIATVISVAAFLPQVLLCWKSKKTADISLPSYLLIESGSLLWFFYGLLTGQIPVILANGIIGVLALFIIIFKLRYK